MTNFNIQFTETMEADPTPPAGPSPSPNQESERPSDPAQAAQPSLQLTSILVPLDFSDMSFKALQYAVPLAKQFGAKITLLHVVQPPSYPPELPYPIVDEQEVLAEAERTLDNLRAARIAPELTADAVVRRGSVVDAIVELALEIPADLIIATTHGFTGLKHVLMGSVAECVVRNAPCPVLVLHERERDFV